MAEPFSSLGDLYPVVDRKRIRITNAGFYSKGLVIKSPMTSTLHSGVRDSRPREVPQTFDTTLLITFA